MFSDIQLTAQCLIIHLVFAWPTSFTFCQIKTMTLLWVAGFVEANATLILTMGQRPL